MHTYKFYQIIPIYHDIMITINYDSNYIFFEFEKLKINTCIMIEMHNNIIRVVVLVVLYLLVKIIYS